MITPRLTRLFRVPTLAAFRTTLADWITALLPHDARDTFVLVPTQAAAEQLRRTVEAHLAATGRTAIVWPILGTRRDLYDELAARMRQPVARLNAFEREVILAGVSRDLCHGGVTPPFELRPGLVAEMLALYDHIRRLGRGIEDFERNFREELEREQETDRGAAKLLQQTLFLAAAYRAYEQRVAASGRLDEHGLRKALEEDAARPLRRVIVTVADRIAEAEGLWPADYNVLTMLPRLDALDFLCTESVLAAGLLERLYAALPEISEERGVVSTRGLPTLVTRPATKVADAPPIAAAYRDREDELVAAARRIKTEQRSQSLPLDRYALVVRRPLPYLYLARDVFADAGIPFETLDTLPLAAEPYAAAIDLVLDAAATDFTRASLLGLLRSPHFGLRAQAETSELESSIGALDFALADERYLGGLDRLEQLVVRWSAIEAPTTRVERRQKTAVTAARIVLNAARQIAPLALSRPLSQQIATLLGWLRTFDAPPRETDSTASRRARVRAAVVGALSALSDAHRRHDPAAHADVVTFTAAIRRWLGSQTFASFTGSPGLQIVEAQAAKYGEFDDIQVVGLIEGEWPERVRRNVLYPSSLLSLLEPLPAIADPSRRERDALNGARAAFKDLLLSAHQRVRLSTFALENDAVVEPSILLDDVGSFGLPRAVAEDARARVSYSEALAIEPREIGQLPTSMAAWAAARISGTARDPADFQGRAGAWVLPRVSVSRLERYLDCPFRFYASEVLRLEEQPEDEDARTPLERGLFLHNLWERFFSEWQRRGHGRVTPDALPEARALFEQLCETALATLTPAEASLERARLLGSAVNPGIAHRVFAMEADRPVRIIERLLEFPLQGDFTFRTRDGLSRLVPLSAKADRIDLLEDGTIRVIDYKSKNTPDLKRALQLPIYSMCARDKLAGRGGRNWSLSEPLYLSFEGERAVVPFRVKGRTIDELLDEAQDRLLQTLDDIASGAFPARPSKKSLCGPCSYRTVCRLEIVEADEGDAT